jgi:hypothetical protein
MVADPGPDVLIWPLTWAYVVAAVAVPGSWGSWGCARVSG